MKESTKLKYTANQQFPQLIKTRRILLVEDDSKIADWIKDKIERTENLILQANYNRLEGVFENIQSDPPDVLILDLKLADGNGIELLKDIKKVNLDINIMVLTIDSQMRNSCLRMGADYFFSKDTDIELFINKLKELAE